MSIVTYGTDDPVTFPYAQITNFDQVAVGDELSDTDLTYTKFDISLQSIVHYDYLDLIAPDLSGRTESPADIMQIIRQRLMRRRQRFQITMGGHDLLPKRQEGIEGWVDARNGPIPQDCKFFDLTNDSFLFSWRVVAHYFENVGETGEPLAVTNTAGNVAVSNRWAESVEIDQCQYSTRTRDGSVAIRSDNRRGMIADQVRSLMAVVGVPDGFLRERSMYRVDPSGLKLAYSVTDREVAVMPPKGSLKAEGNYYESVGRQGTVRMGEVYVRLFGDKDADRTDLLDLAILIGLTRLQTRSNNLAVLQGGRGAIRTQKLGFKNVIIMAARAGFEFYDQHVVEFRATAQIPTPPLGARKQGIQGFVGMGTSTPLSNGTYPKPEYRDRGTAGLLLQAARYYDPKVQATILGRDDQPRADNLNVPTGHPSTNLTGGARKPGQAGTNPE